MAGNPITLPELGGGATDGELVAWLVEAGETVEDDQPIAEVETEKSVVEVPTPTAGTVTERLVEAGETVEVGAEILRIEPDESASAESEPTEAEADTAADEPTDAPADEGGVPEGRVFAPPRVRRLARELGVDIASVDGSEAGGRISDADVRAAADSETESEDSGPKPFSPSGESAVSKREADSGAGDDGPKPITPSGESAVSAAGSADTVRPTVASSVHHDTAVVEALDGLRADLDPHAAEQGVELTLLPLVIKAVVRTLADVPALNATIDAEGTVDERDDIHVGIAVAGDDGLVTPVVEHAAEKSLLDLAAEIGEQLDGAAAGERPAEATEEATITLTVPGAIGDEHATLPIEGDRTASLALGAVGHRPVVAEGDVVARETLPLSLAVDPRAADPTEAAAFLEGVVGLLESPNRLLLASS